MSDKTLKPDSPNPDSGGEESLLGEAGGTESGRKENQANDTRGKVERLFPKDFTEAHPDLFEGVKSVSDLVSGLLAKNKNAVIRDGMSPDEMGAYRKLHGIPEKSTDYEFPNLDMFDEPAAQKIAHEAGLSQTQSKAMEAWVQHREDQRNKRIDSEKSAMKRETREWLEAKYGQNAQAQLIRADSILSRLADEDFAKEVKLSGLGNSKGFISLLLHFADAISESSGTNPRAQGGKPIDPREDEDAFHAAIFGGPQ